MIIYLIAPLTMCFAMPHLDYIEPASRNPEGDPLMLRLPVIISVEPGNDNL